MARILLVVDNSNVHVQTKESFGQDARFSYLKFEKHFYENDFFVEKQMTGSTPPSTDAFWDKMKREGYKVMTYERKRTSRGKMIEKGIDTAIVARATEAIITLKPELLVLFSGDLDMKPLVEMAKKYSCTVYIWTYKESLSPDLKKESDDVFYIDDFLNELIFYQDYQGNIESFSERKEREELKKQEAAERRRRIVETSENDEESSMPSWLKWTLGIGGVAGIVGIGLRILRKR